MDLESPAAVLSPESIFLGRAPESMESAIDFVGGHLVERGIVNPGYIQGMKDREQTVSTYLGNGVALPHGTYDTRHEINGTGIVIAQYPAGIAWGENTVHLVIGLAAAGDDHVEVLSQLAEVLQDEAVCTMLWTAQDPGVVHETLTGAIEADTSNEMHAHVTITNPAGLHARPAALIVQRAKSFDAEVTIVKGGKTANAKSVMSLLALGAATGDSVMISARGTGSAEALESVTEILTSTEDH